MKDDLVEVVARAICKAETLPPYTVEQAWASNNDDFRQAAQAALSAISQAGYAVVPVEATEAMARAGFNAQYKECRNVEGVYRAMVAAGRVDGG